MSTTERRSKRRKYIGHNLIVLTISLCIAMIVKSVSAENDYCRFLTDTDTTAARITPQGSKALDRVAFSDTMEEPYQDEAPKPVPWEKNIYHGKRQKDPSMSGKKRPRRKLQTLPDTNKTRICRGMAELHGRHTRRSGAVHEVKPNIIRRTTMGTKDR